MTMTCIFTPNINITLFKCFSIFLPIYLKFVVSLKPQLKSLPWFPSPPNKIQKFFLTKVIFFIAFTEKGKENRERERNTDRLPPTCDLTED